MFNQKKLKASNQKVFLLGGSKVDGSTFVSANTLETIASIATQEIKGVHELSENPVIKVASFINKDNSNSKGVSVTQNPDGTLDYVVKVSLEYGINIPKTAVAIQNAIKTAVVENTELPVHNVDLIIESYTPKKDVKAEAVTPKKPATTPAKKPAVASKKTTAPKAK
jgi:uncharacterized alkaline shock family protein YloU